MMFARRCAVTTSNIPKGKGVGKSCFGLDHVSSRERFRKVGDLLAKQYSFFYFFSFIHYSLLINDVVAQLYSKYFIRELVCMLGAIE